jgi:ribosomal protein S18 acetylase RimI-like enzyme
MLGSAYVSKDHRKQGVFGKLYQEIAKIGREDPHCKSIRLQVDMENKNAQKTYSGLGMSENGVFSKSGLYKE